MTAHHEAPELTEAKDILNQCTQFMPADTAYLEHDLIRRFGSPEQPIYIDQTTAEINGFTYENPLIMPIYDGQLELIQCAVMQDKSLVSVMPSGLARGFSYYGELIKDKPVIITYGLEPFFKLASCGLSVILVILPTLCNNTLSELKPFDFEQIQHVINQLSQAGYKRLYLPVLPHLFSNESFKTLEKNTAVRLLNQYQKIGDSEFITMLTKDEDNEEIGAFVDEAVTLLPQKDPLPKGHLAKPMKWEDGYFHVLSHGLFFIEKSDKGDEIKRYISSPVLVTAKTRDDTSTNWGVLLEWIDDNGVKHTQALSMELFQTDGAELRKALAYQGVTISPNKRARDLFQCYLMTYQTGKYALCVDRVGWHGDVFVLPHEPIGQSSNGDLIVYQANHGLDNRYQSKGTLEQWRSNVSLLVQNHSKLIFALCTAFTGQLLDPLNQQGGGFHFKGGSSKGKSTALYLACSVWGNPKQFYRTWRATGNALEHTAYMHNDSFLVLDEIGEIANPKELGTIVYMLSNGLGKGRMTKQITAKPMHQWKIIFLSSGEKSLKEIMQEQGQKSKLGQEIRLADIDIDQSEHGVFDQIDFAHDGAKQSIELVSRLNQSYGVAGIAWLNYLTSNKTEHISEARELLEQYRQALTVNQSQGHIVRVANYFALVATAGELATRANITGWTAGTAFTAVHKVFDQWLGGFEQVGDFEDREILAQVKAFFEANESSRFESVTPDPAHQEKINNRVGYWKIENGEKVFYVMSEQFKNEVCKGFDSRKAAKVLLSYGLLEHDTGKNTKTVRLPTRSKSLRVYAIKESIFSYDIDNIEGNKGNKGNNPVNKGFEHVAHSEMQKATKATNEATDKRLQDKTAIVAPCCPSEIKTGNSLKASDSKHVARVAHVAQEKQSICDLLSDPAQPEPAKEIQLAAKKQVKAAIKQPEPIPANDDNLDLFGGML